jgi:hypothetical protein
VHPEQLARLEQRASAAVRAAVRQPAGKDLDAGDFHAGRQTGLTTKVTKNTKAGPI